MLGTEKGNGDQFTLHLLWSSPTLWGCVFHPGVCEVWERTKHAELQEPKLMFVKGWLFLKTFYEIPYLDCPSKHSVP